MTYQETLDYLFNSLPMYHRIGKAAYKADINNTVQLMEHLGHPERGFRSIHVAGTNGKGSVSHTLCSVLIQAGYKVGLYTSPHLKDFRERIRINGEMISEDAVAQWVERHRVFMKSLDLSFFEMTVGLAFDYFAQTQVDVAVIEVGMGGRLDSTNVLTPDLSVITNIGLEHTQFLGDTLAKIAFEKAGIIKPQVPVVIGETQPETTPVYLQRAAEGNSPIYFADQKYKVSPIEQQLSAGNLNEYDAYLHFTLQCEGDCPFATDVEYVSQLSGSYQVHNMATVFQAIDCLVQQGYHIQPEHVANGIARVVSDTGLHGRWDVVSKSPLLIFETAHNVAGVEAMKQRLNEIPYRHLYLVYGCVNDKNFQEILRLLPQENTSLVFTNPSVPRALPVAELYAAAKQEGVEGQPFDTVGDAIAYCIDKADVDRDLVFVTGSIFLVADALQYWHNSHKG